MAKLLFSVATTVFAATALADVDSCANSVEQRNWQKAYEACADAAQNNHLKSQVFLADMYKYGHYVEQNISKALEIYRSAANNGNAEAQERLGGVYADGVGVIQDYGKAVGWWRLAAKQGKGSSQYNLGVAYRNGFGVAENALSAHIWFNLAAATDDNDAARKWRDELRERLTAEQIKEAQQRASECLTSNYQNCD
jgi:TPR repeat protein